MTLGEQYPLEQARLRRILGHYKEIGPPGAFAAMGIERDLAEADAAAISGDLPRMIAAFREMQTWKE